MSLRKRTAMHRLNKTETLQIIAHVCQRYGCEIIRLDFDRHILDLDGPADARKKCMQDLEVFLDG